MLQSIKKKTEGVLYNFTERCLENPSPATQQFLEPVHSNLIIKRFQRHYLGTKKNITIDSDYSKEIQTYWKQLAGIHVNPAWHHLIKSFNGHEDPRYITPKMWIEYFNCGLNSPKYHDPLIVDKNALDLYIDKEHLPKTVFKIIDGKLFDSKPKKITFEQAKDLLLADDHDKFLKPSRLFQGLGVYKIQNEDGTILLGGEEITFQEFIKRAGDNAIIQYAVDQHPKIASVHSHSLNTLRMITVRIGTEIYFLGGSIKFGADKNVADNTGNGILCGINDDHTLMNIGYNRLLQIFTKHHNSGITFKEFGKIPSYQRAIDLCKEVHETLLFHDFAAWDVAIQNDGTPLIVELNSKPTTITWQIRMKQPLFRDLTDEVWKYMLKKGDQ